MNLTANTLDDLLRHVLARLLATKARVVATKGASREAIGAVLRLRNPRARLSLTEQKGHLVSGLGELLWYLAGSDDPAFVSYYLPHYKQYTGPVYGAYGPRLQPQLPSLIRLLEETESTRRAVIQLYSEQDIHVADDRMKQVPCTTTLQVLVRQNRLHMVASMRSNDALIGLPHDVFAFTMIQELLARRMRVELGHYTHMVGSLHLYESGVEDAERYLAEGWQELRPMPPMPSGDPFESVAALLQVEESLRSGRDSGGIAALDRYWADLAHILEAFAVQKRCPPDAEHRVASIRAGMHFDVYDPFVERHQQRTARALEKARSGSQVPLFRNTTDGYKEPREG